MVTGHRAAAALSGWAAEQAVGQPLDALIVPPSSHAAHRAGLETSRRTGRGRGLQGRSALSLVVLDLDRSTTDNDAHGHPAGDRLLQEVAQAWQDAVDGRGWLARLGEDEFALLRPEGDEDTAAAVLAAVVAAEALLQRADALLYAGKRSR